MTISFGSALRRGALAGVSAGLSAAVLLWLVVEPLIEQAIAIEESRSRPGLAGLSGGGHTAPFAPPAHGTGEPLVSRAAQVLAGGVTMVLVGVALGLVFAVVFVNTRHRIAGTGDFGRSIVLSAVGFGVASLLPALALPASPPGVGDAATVGRRTTLYLVVLLLGVVVALAVPSLDRWLALRLPGPTRWALVIAAVALAVVLVLTLVPDPSGPVPEDVPAALLWDFRLASLGQLAMLWLVLGTTFGLFMERAKGALSQADRSGGVRQDPAAATA